MKPTAEATCGRCVSPFSHTHIWLRPMESGMGLARSRISQVGVSQMACAGKENLVARAINEVLTLYDGSRRHWSPPLSDRITKISFGGRAGVIGVRLGSERCCVKLYYDDRLRTKARALLGWTRARRAFRNGLKASRCGVRCPQVLGYAKAGPFGPSLLVMELIEPAMPLNRWIPEHGIDHDFVRQFAAFVRDMHDTGVSHIDLQLRNVMVRLRNPAEGACVAPPKYEFVLVDLEDIRIHRSVSPRGRAADLHRLNKWGAMKIVPLRWRLEFLRQYLRGGCLRPWLKKVAFVPSQEPILRRLCRKVTL
jgi:tRNA A-37 threonylcarbamoyl transferase component Bud32